jgi:beta-1,2-mannosidase
LILLTAVSARADLSQFKLCSPRNGDHFEATKPLLFWQSSVGASRYEVFVDDTLIAEVNAAPIPVMSYPIAAPLPPGTHRWFVKASGSGDEIESSNFVFTVKPSTHWPSWAIGPFVKYGANPILRPERPGWESWNVYNPGVIFDDGWFRMLYRGQENNKVGPDTKTLSRIGYAESLDGVTFLPNAVPVIDATEPFESRYGCEDARLVKYRGVYYAFYTGNLSASSSEICLCEATSHDCVHWNKLGIIETNTKNGAIVRDPAGTPVKIHGKFVMFTGNSNLGVCYSRDLIHWGPITWIDPHFPAGWIAPYEPCVAVAEYSRNQPDNIVLFIAGTLNGKGKWFYAISEMLFSKSDLRKKVAQLDDCIMKPIESYESGTFQNCIWMNSILLHNGQWWMHYGAGDRNIGLATAPGLN